MLKEIERVTDQQLVNFQSLTSRAGAVLSILIGALTAALTVAGVIARPPEWAILIPSIPLIAALITSCLVFLGSEVTIGPTPESLVERLRDPEEDVQVELARFYARIDAGDPGDSEHEGFIGNRRLLHRKQRLFEIAVLLLAVTVASLIAVALLLYVV